VVTAYTLCFAGLLLLGGRISDVIGRRRAFLVGLGGFALASLLAGLATDLPVLDAGRALQGAAAALISPSALSLLAVTFTDRGERAKAFAVFGAVVSCGAAVGLLVGGLLTDFAGWRWCLFVNVAIAAVVVALGRNALPDAAPTGGTRYRHHLGRTGHRRPGCSGLRVQPGSAAGLVVAARGRLAHRRRRGAQPLRASTAAHTRAAAPIAHPGRPQPRGCLSRRRRGRRVVRDVPDVVLLHAGGFALLPGACRAGGVAVDDRQRGERLPAREPAGATGAAEGSARRGSADRGRRTSGVESAHTVQRLPDVSAARRSVGGCRHGRVVPTCLRPRGPPCHRPRCRCGIRCHQHRHPGGQLDRHRRAEHRRCHHDRGLSDHSPRLDNAGRRVGTRLRHRRRLVCGHPRRCRGDRGRCDHAPSPNRQTHP